MEKYSLEDYIEVDSDSIWVFLGAIAQFKNAVCTILVSTKSSSLFILPDIDGRQYEWFEKHSFILTWRGTMIPWKTPNQ